MSDSEESKNHSTFKTETSEISDKDSVDSGSDKKKKNEIKEPEMDEEEKKKREEMKDFRTYLTKVLDDSIVKKSEISNLNFESWFIDKTRKLEQHIIAEDHMTRIKVKYRLDGKPHEITITVHLKINPLIINKI